MTTQENLMISLNSCSEYISEAAVKNSSTKLAKDILPFGMVTEIGRT